MKYFLKIAAIALISLCSFLSGFSQKPPIKFGDIPLDQLKMTIYEKDSSASAVILTNYGSSRFDYGTDQFQVIFKKHVRIKILNKDGYEWADHQIQLYNNNGGEETFGNLKGMTYNFEKGRVVKTKLQKESIFKEKIDNNHDKVKFTMPNVKEGSIIEYTYEITSEFLFNYRGWSFQESIPVVWSEYRASFIEYYNYKHLLQGYIPLHINEKQSGQQKFSIRVDKKIDVINRVGFDNKGGLTGGYTNDYVAQNTRYRWVAKDVPAFISEPYMTTAKNYISMVNFELEREQFPNQPIKYHRGSWEEVNAKFLAYDSFGEKVKGSGFLKKELEAVVSNQDSELEKINKVYNFVKTKIKWNGINAKYLESNLKKPFDEGKGSSAEINLLLTSMLQKAGIIADPVLISTRTNRFIRENNVVSSQFNYVICKVQLGDKYILLDATEPYLPLTALPERCLNEKGFVISETNFGWVDIVPNYKKSTKIGGEITISEDGELTGSLKYNYGGYTGLKQRKSYFGKGQEDFIADKESNSKWEVEEIEIENEEDYSKPFMVKFNAIINEGVESMGNLIYLDPILSGKHEKNPFTLEKREYPIDFSCPIVELYYTTFTMPEGYQLDSPLEPFSVSLPENAGKFIYSITTNGNKIIVMSKLNINKTLFVMNEYPYIKEFFAQIVAKQHEQIVLKKL